MTTYEFIFSEKVSKRMVRHAAFWLVFALHVFFFRFYVVDLKYLFYFNTYLVRLKDLVLFLPASVFYAYFAMYFLLPRYILTEKYGRLLMAIAGMSILLILFSWALSILFDIKLAWDLPINRDNIVRKLDFTFNNGFVYPLAVSGFAIGIKMGKNFYVQQTQNKELAIQKASADVQLLKSQVYPRFLFHSLKTIYNDMLNDLGKSPEMLLKLSDLLSYILYESDKLMPLDKELILMKNYIDLEATGLGSQLVVNISDTMNTDNKFIEPLLLLPLTEYIFEKVDKYKQHQVFLNVRLQVKKHDLLFTFITRGLSKISGNDPEENTHLLRLRRRLQLRYAGRHDLKITIGKDDMSVFLSLAPEELQMLQ